MRQETFLTILDQLQKVLLLLFCSFMLYKYSYQALQEYLEKPTVSFLVKEKLQVQVLANISGIQLSTNKFFSLQKFKRRDQHFHSLNFHSFNLKVFFVVGLNGPPNNPQFICQMQWPSNGSAFKLAEPTSYSKMHLFLLSETLTVETWLLCQSPTAWA